MDYLKRYKKMVSLRGFTEHTVTSYATYISAYLDYLKNTLHKFPSDASYKDQIAFLDYLKTSRNLSDRTINAVISQLRFFTLYVLHKSWDSTKIPFKKFNKFLPFVPTQSEVKIFISSVTNLKVKAMLALMYSSGLRIGEVCNLRYEDIQRKNMRIHVVHSKSRSDRFAILSKEALDILTDYWYKYGKPTSWLFPKQRDVSKPIDTFYLCRHIASHEKELGWPKRFTCHCFRHAFGTHLYENGADLITIKTLMGHKTLESTSIYVHLAVSSNNVPLSPFDIIMGERHE